MSDFAVSWELCRGRLMTEIEGLSHAQIHWRMHPDALTIAESILHVAGVEVYFAQQLTGASLDAFGERVKASATQGVVNDEPFPFSTDEVTLETLVQAMALAKSMSEPIITAPSPELLEKELKSALGPMITGRGALARWAFHPGYHQGQIYLMKTAPGFPAN